jgi:hypothetical protein
MTMIFFREKALALRFRNGTVPSRERFFYVLGVSLVNYLTYSLMDSLLGKDPIGDVYWYFNTSITIIFLIVGTKICYNTNQSGDDKEFIERFISLGFPVLIQYTLLLMMGIAGIYTVAITKAWSSKNPVGVLLDFRDTSMVCFALLNVALSLFYYLRLNAAIRLAAHET